MPMCHGKKKSCKCHGKRKCCQNRCRMMCPLFAFIFGATMGLLLSPAKRGINTGKITNNYYGKDEPVDHREQEHPE